MERIYTLKKSELRDQLFLNMKKRDDGAKYGVKGSSLAKPGSPRKSLGGSPKSPKRSRRVRLAGDT